MSEPILITSTVGSQYSETTCVCGERVAVSEKDQFCAMCGELLDKDPEKMTAVHIEAGKPRLKCQTCNADVYSNSTKTNDELVNTGFCPVCGGGDLEAYDEEEPTEEQESTDVQNALSDTDIEGLEAALLSQPEQQWVVFANGEPILKLRLSKQPEESRYVFSTTQFPVIFKQRALETSLFAAAKEFNADIIDQQKIVSVADVEDVAYERLQAIVIPRFLDCMSIAIEGMTRNFYPELNGELKANFYDELKARGINDPEDIIEASFDSAGSTVFAALVTKAMELYNKPEEIRAELKTTIFSTSKVKTSKVSQEAQEQREFKERLVAANVPVVSTEPILATTFAKASVDDIRGRLNLSRR